MRLSRPVDAGECKDVCRLPAELVVCLETRQDDVEEPEEDEEDGHQKLAGQSLAAQLTAQDLQKKR